ncbi:hypothetical protein POM88_036201 [Heracleum sosnowskyi]|uniref:Uncharacterized protein n=1 Tax=Heracleum sosnowskyi TaxID=360622 RepID=A0AAD8HPC4_9APIA|nr:hypothetical protein POM88_036201 [Heracleum sosnowskyi]
MDYEVRTDTYLMDYEVRMDTYLIDYEVRMDTYLMDYEVRMDTYLMDYEVQKVRTHGLWEAKEVVMESRFSQERWANGFSGGLIEAWFRGSIKAKTRKRKPGREYKSNPDVMQFRVDTINKKLQSAEGLDGLDELVSSGKKSHGPGWLIGRHDVKCVKASTQNTAPPAPTDSYIQELTKKLRQEVVEEVEVKLN